MLTSDLLRFRAGVRAALLPVTLLQLRASAYVPLFREVRICRS